jgi:pyridoxal phosphate enzyme (YggS family)
MTYPVAEKIESFRAALPPEVELVAVSKTKPVEMLQAAYQVGQRHFGENRVQEMADKYEQLPKDIKWHMVGHVQSNKIKYMAPFVHLVHGMDKPKRLKELNKEAAKNNRQIDCLLQIHIAQEESKFGFDYTEARQLLEQKPGEKYPHLRIRGLMGMATLTDDQDQVRREFAGLAAFFREQQSLGHLAAFDILSMGMSGDYQIAMEEGANMIRIGSTLFGPR